MNKLIINADLIYTSTLCSYFGFEEFYYNLTFFEKNIFNPELTQLIIINIRLFD